MSQTVEICSNDGDQNLRIQFKDKKVSATTIIGIIKETYFIGANYLCITG
jgi:hypothetical protein